MSYDPHSNEWLLNRFDIYKNLRAQDTAYWCEKYNVHVITRYDDVFFVLNNPQIFSSAQGNLLIETPNRFGNTPGASDNPIHDEYKNIVKNAYTKDNLKRVADVFHEKTVEQLENKTLLNISDITDEISSWATVEILNIPIDGETIKNLTLATHRYHPLVVLHNADPNLNTKYRIIFDLVRRRVPSKGPGVYHEYIYNNPKKLDVMSLIIGKMMTGPGSLAAALQYLTIDLCEQKQLDNLLNDRSLVAEAVKESLRFRAGVGRFTRTVAQEITMHGVDLKPGDRVAVCLESANRDPNMFEDPDTFIISRNNKAKHLSWGHGVHACIALAISEKLLGVYLNLLLDKVGKYEILTKPSDIKYTMMLGGHINIMSNIMLRKL